jgi:hypothetical protein
VIKVEKRTAERVCEACWFYNCEFQEGEDDDSIKLRTAKFYAVYLIPLRFCHWPICAESKWARAI